ncbi:hypothetical protein ABT224_19830 [Streptomyces sp. NPDC001584]|uniref:hypothetical protein n=1 Tax=Streptomyces sp. NPDC001584 TaxID=3154521 RepID=UPI00332200F7
MSCNRDNVTWQAPAGTWSIGFWRFAFTTQPGGEDFDHEWDVEYFEDAFWFCSTGHPTIEAAMDAYRAEEANPGGTVIVRAHPGNAEEIARYEALAAQFKAQNGHRTSIACP